MIRFRMYFDKDKETEWLNEMARKGWAMTKFFAGFYSFEPCEKGEYLYQIDFGDSLFRIDGQYREFMEEMEVEILQPWGFWIILRKKASQGDFVLYTDVDSRIENYSRIRKMFKAVAVLEIACTMFELYCAVQGNPMGYAAACLTAAFAVVCINMALKTTNIIHELQDRKSGGCAGNRARAGQDAKAGQDGAEGGKNSGKKNPVSGALTAGLLLNSCGLALGHSAHPYLKTAVQLMAGILILVGAVQTLKRRKA